MARGRTVHSEYGELFVTVSQDRSSGADRECGDKLAWNIRVKNRKTSKVWSPSARLCTRHESKKRAVEDAVTFYEAMQERKAYRRRRSK